MHWAIGGPGGERIEAVELHLVGHFCSTHSAAPSSPLTLCKNSVPRAIKISTNRGRSRTFPFAQPSVESVDVSLRETIRVPKLTKSWKCHHGIVLWRA